MEKENWERPETKNDVLDSTATKIATQAMKWNPYQKN